MLSELGQEGTGERAPRLGGGGRMPKGQPQPRANTAVDDVFGTRKVGDFLIRELRDGLWLTSRASSQLSGHTTDKGPSAGVRGGMWRGGEICLIFY